MSTRILAALLTIHLEVVLYGCVQVPAQPADSGTVKASQPAIKGGAKLANEEEPVTTRFSSKHEWDICVGEALDDFIRKCTEEHGSESPACYVIGGGVYVYLPVCGYAPTPTELPKETRMAILENCRIRPVDPSPEAFGFANVYGVSIYDQSSQLLKFPTFSL
jgi:hypothetical protein